MNLSQRSINFMVGFVVAGIFAYCGYEAHASFAKKHIAQERNFKLLRQSRIRLDGVIEYGEKFDQSFTMIDGTPDMLELYETLRIKEVSDVSPDSISLVSITQMRGGGKPIPLYEICLANNSKGFELDPANVADALVKAKMIDARQDISYKNLRLYSDNSSLKLLYDSICVLGRVQT